MSKYEYSDDGQMLPALPEAIATALQSLRTWTTPYSTREQADDAEHALRVAVVEALAELLTREPLALSGGEDIPTPTHEEWDRLARIVYEAMQEHSPEGATRPWVDGGNSHAQCTARIAVRRVYSALSAAANTTPAARGEAVAWARATVKRPDIVLSLHFAEEKPGAHDYFVDRPLVFGDTHPPRADALVDDVLRCIPADWKPGHAREWGKLGPILAEFIDDLREGRYPHNAPHRVVRVALVEVADAPGVTVTEAMVDAAGHAVAEVSRAMAKFPTWPTDPLHALSVVGEEFGELQQAVLQHIYEPKKGVTTEDIRTEAMQLAAMALRFYASLPVYRYVRGEQHDQTAALSTGDAAGEYVAPSYCFNGCARTVSEQGVYCDACVSPDRDAAGEVGR